MDHVMDEIDGLAYKFWAIHPRDLDQWADNGAPTMPPKYPGGMRAWYFACTMRSLLKLVPPTEPGPKPLTAAVLADAFDCFNNDALTLMHGGTHDIGCIAGGFAAIAARLRES